MFPVDRTVGSGEEEGVTERDDASHHRRWTDPRDGREWTIRFNPGVELARPRERSFRSRLIFESGDERYHTGSVYGADLESLTDRDLEGLLDQARRSADADGPPG